ncbi:SAM-dependent methyltransferase [Legionella sp. MW5194]|uniref:SAM-dependent methyltransferase n=1 Tax=Legionella sp. MW5194 TaxID=2662448 RepID=UPI00193CCBEC|nr:SAM-dependent methyltransferase [Legionella sp. MW5194]QRN04874.1 SAM-dependent methyltransferase [Legionella sp. MW5194]
MDTVKNAAAIYLAKPEYHKELAKELGKDSLTIGDLFFSPRQSQTVCFAKDSWLNPQFIEFESISQAAAALKNAGKFWYLHPLTHVRRGRLIEEKLRKTPSLMRHFPLTHDLPPVNVFFLLDKNTLVYSTERTNPWPDGECLFIEDKVNPPNRAYLKLWEALTLLNHYPKAGEKALDLGASPGGWTFVMQSLGASVTAVDKAPLADPIAGLPRVHFLKQSAFALEPDKLTESYDWVLSDVACYPERAFRLIKQWIASGKAKQLIFTIKLQGETDLQIIKELQNIPNSRVLNLFYNKHEATFFHPFPG